MPFRFPADFIVLVTGASRGIGLALAEVAGEAGATVVLAARSGKVLEEHAARLRDAGGNAHALPMDVTEEAEVRDGFQQVVAKHGKLDAVLLSAGVAAFTPILETTAAALEHHFRVNVLGTFLGAREAMRHMVEHGQGGHIVTIGSIAEQRAFPMNGAYAATKAAVGKLAAVLREECRVHHIRVTHVIPGATDTPLWDGLGDFPREKMAAPRDLARLVIEAIRPGSTAVVEDLVIKPPIGEF